MTAQAFDLAERLQTPIIILSDLDLGMNDHMSAPFEWDDDSGYDRGKVLNEKQLDQLTAQGKRFGRYLDVDGDGICYRTYPGTHADKGAFFTRGTSRDAYAVYTEDGDEYVRNMERLELKFETAKRYLPEPKLKSATDVAPINEDERYGVIYFGTSDAATEEAMDILAENGMVIDGLRVRAFPFNSQVEEFISTHHKVFVVEQNRDGQLRSLLINELEINPKQLLPVLNYDGSPISAAVICSKIRQHCAAEKATELRQA